MIIKKLLIMMITIAVFATVGYQLNKNKPDEWHSRYDLSINPTAKIFLISLNKNLELLKVLDGAHKSFYNFAIETIRDQEINLRKKYPELRGIMIQENKLAFSSNSLDDIDETVDELIKGINDQLYKDVIQRLELFTTDAKLVLEKERQIEVRNLKDAVKFYNKKKNKITSEMGEIESKRLTKIQGLKNAVNKYKVTRDEVSDVLVKIDKYLENEQKQSKDILSVKSLQKQMSVLERYSSFNKLELTLQQRETENIYDNLNLIKTEMIKDNIGKVDILILRGLGKRFNKRPTLLYSIISFSTIGFFVGIILLFLIVNLKTLKRLVLKMLSTSRDLK